MLSVNSGFKKHYVHKQNLSVGLQKENEGHVLIQFYIYFNLGICSFAILSYLILTIFKRKFYITSCQYIIYKAHVVILYIYSGYILIPKCQCRENIEG